MPDRDPLLQEREKTHGSFKQNALTWNVLTSAVPMNFAETNVAQRLALDMLLMKIARIISNPNIEEHWIDAAGYAKLGAEACK